jgi:hypothetical protein
MENAKNNIGALVNTVRELEIQFVQGDSVTKTIAWRADGKDYVE